MILAEVENEVNAYMKKLETARWAVNFAMGALSFIPGVVGKGLAFVVGSAGNALIGHKSQRKGYGKSASLAQEEIALTNYGPGKIEVKLCFGTIVIPLESKIKIAH